MNNVFTLISNLYRNISPPAPESAPTEHPSLVPVFAKAVTVITPRELCHIVGWIAPGLHDHLNVLRYYLPRLMMAYSSGHLPCEEELQCRLLQYWHSFSAEERKLLAEVAVGRWKNHSDASLYVQESSFLLFWCDDLAPLRSIFLRAQAPPVETNSLEEFQLRLLSELRQEVLKAGDPLACLWRHLYYPLDPKLYEAIVAEKGTDVMAFLKHVEWLPR